MIIVTNTTIYKYAVVITFCNTTFANMAMLGSGGLKKMTGSARITRVEDCEVIRIDTHLMDMV